MSRFHVFPRSWQRCAGLVFATLLLCLCIAAPGVTRAAACCLSTSAFGTGRLAIWEEAAFGLSSSYGTAHGAWDPAGRYLRFTDYEEREGRVVGWGIVRLSPSLEASVRLPWVFTEKATATLADNASGPGDPAFGLRWDLIPIGAWQGLPGVALTFGASAPMGRAPGQSRTVLGSDVTTRGAWIGSVGVSLERAHEPFFVRLDVAGSYAFPSTVAGETQRLGPGLELSLGGGVEILDGLVLSAAPRLVLEGATERGGATVPGSEQREAALAWAASWKFDPHWTVQAAVDHGLPFDGFTQNRQLRTVGQLGLRYGWF